MRRLLAVLLALAVGGCASSSGSSTSSSSSSSSSSSAQGTVTVFAAASLKEAFGTLGTRFEAAHPGAKVVFSFGPSSGLAQQVTSGAPADVFASASPAPMAAVATKVGGTARTFATNRLEIAVPSDDPAHVQALADLARPGVKVALCQAQVPCGALAAKVLAEKGLKVRPVTEEVDVKSVLAKVQLGEVDAGLVYVTDVRAAGGKVRGVAVPSTMSTAYPILALTKGALARDFVDEVLSPEGRSVLTAAGFGPP